MLARILQAQRQTGAPKQCARTGTDFDYAISVPRAVGMNIENARCVPMQLVRLLRMQFSCQVVQRVVGTDFEDAIFVPIYLAYNLTMQDTCQTMLRNFHARNLSTYSKIKYVLSFFPYIRQIEYSRIINCNVK